MSSSTGIVWLNTAETARRLGVTPRTLYRFIDEGQLPAYRFTPVIMLTTESQESKKAEGRAAGARAWITKPFQPSTLVDAVNKLCV